VAKGVCVGYPLSTLNTGFQLIRVADLDVEVWLNTASDPLPADWLQACRAVAESVDAKNGDASSHRMFVVTDGGTPNATQRKQLNRDALRGLPVKIAVVTPVAGTNPIKRGIATAIQWLNPEFRIFEPREVVRALDHIRVTRVQFESIWTTLTIMQRSLPPNETLRLIAGELGLAVPEPTTRPQTANSRHPTS
jgi:hypothetical protein